VIYLHRQNFVALNIYTYTITTILGRAIFTAT